MNSQFSDLPCIYIYILYIIYNNGETNELHTHSWSTCIMSQLYLLQTHQIINKVVWKLWSEYRNFNVFLSLYVYMVYMYVCMSVWRPEDNTWQLLQSSSYFLKQGLSVHTVLIIMVLINSSLLANQNVPDTRLPLPHHHWNYKHILWCLVFIYSFGIWTQILMTYMFSFKLSSLMISVFNPSSVKIE